ncbi:MAG: hypothetical protein WBF90_33040 [Rivularia sp. (in: cyanobacteria)]|jgi:uncharacterized protein YraI
MLKKFITNGLILASTLGISASFVNQTQTPVQAQTIDYGYVCTKGTGINLLTDSGKVIETIPRNARVSIKGYSDKHPNWLKVSYAEISGWVYKDYIYIWYDSQSCPY